MIGVILPSRGLIHSRTLESLTEALKGFEYKFYFSHDNPIPTCFNIPITEALKDSPDYIWIVEEDMAFPEDTLRKLLDADTEIATMDYRLENGQMCYYETSGYLLGGTGCILIKADTMRKLMPLSSVAYGLDLKPIDGITMHYGGQDIDLCVRAQDMGIKPVIVGTVDHLRVKQMGDRNVNNGTHEVTAL